MGYGQQHQHTRTLNNLGTHPQPAPVEQRHGDGVADQRLRRRACSPTPVRAQPPAQGFFQTCTALQKEASPSQEGAGEPQGHG